MATQKRSIIPLLLILGVLSLAAYLITTADSEKGRRDSASRRIRSAPDISLEGIRQTFMENGQKKWGLKAASARLSRSSQQTRVEDIDAVFFTTDGKPFHVTADSGLISFDTKDAEISGNVVIYNQDYKIYTQALRYQAEQNIIITNGPVKIESDSLRLTGDRLRYNLLSMKAELAGNVNGIIKENLTRQ